MNRRSIVVLLVFVNITALAQNRPGFIYHYPSHQYTTGFDIGVLSQNRYLVYNYLHNDQLAGSYYLLSEDEQCLTILDSSLTSIDTTIYLNDTSSVYNHSYLDQETLGDTTYFLFAAHTKNSSGYSKYRPVNLVFFKMDFSYNLIKEQRMFAADTVGVLGYQGTDMSYNSRLGQFEIFFEKYDTVQQHSNIVLIRFDHSGNLQYYKEWQYTVHTPFLASISDFENLGHGKYLLSQRVVNDIYLIADTALNEIDTSYFKPEIRKLTTIRETDDSYILMGMSDGYKITSLEDGKLQYVFLELDKQSLHEKSRAKYKVQDTITFPRIESEVYRNSFYVLPDGDYLFACREVFYYPDGINGIRFTSIYRMDSMANIVWQYRMADTTFQENFGGSTLNPLPSTDEFLWHNAHYTHSATTNPGYTWVMKFKADGSTLKIGEYAQDGLKNFDLYPNPVKDRFMIVLPFIPEDQVEVRIMSITGKLLQQNTFVRKDNLLQITTNLNSGEYIVEVATRNYRTSRKLIVK